MFIKIASLEPPFIYIATFHILGSGFGLYFTDVVAFS